MSDHWLPGANWSDSVFTGCNASNSLNTLEASVALSYEWLTFKTGATLTEYFGWRTNNSPTNGGFFGDSTAGVAGSTRYSPFVELNAAYEFAEGWTFTASYSASSEPNAYKNFLSLANGTSSSDIARDKFFVSLNKAF